MPISISFEGEVVRTDDLTLAEAITIEELTGDSWVAFNPVRNARHAEAVLLLLLQRKGVALAEAKERVSSLTLAQVVDCFELVDDDLPDYFEGSIPKAEGAPETSGSAGPPSTSSGPLT